MNFSQYTIPVPHVLTLAVWTGAVFATILDWGITVYLLPRPQYTGAVAVSRTVYRQTGPVGLLVKDLLLLAGAYIWWRVVLEPVALAAPLGVNARWLYVFNNFQLLAGTI